MDLKGTVNLPTTDFSMKANLPSMEPAMLEKWREMGIYRKIRDSRQGREPFVLHDGPPYANGHIHLGTTLNKVLKDIIVKSKTMAGYDAPYLPGWDCHGLPIEIKVVGKKRSNLDLVKARRQCREYAAKYVGIQRDEFRRLGVFGDWENPYLTMTNGYEAGIARLLARFVRQGSVYKGFKPVHWCISCETALAEAEVEYGDHTSDSVYVKFPIPAGVERWASEAAGCDSFVLIWTTTPWTLPANLALCFHRDFQYSFIRVGSEVFLLARDLADQVARECGFADFRILATVKGEALKSLVARHAWLDRESKTVFGTHVTLEQGTGVVHTAPGHGQEDYVTGLEYGLEIYCPVDNSGRFTPDVEHFAEQQVFEANPKITAFLEEQGILVSRSRIVHSYPHCWRCHNPVIFRATPQWFIGMEQNDLRRKSLEAIREVSWKPVWGEDRISNMIANRPDWCISRQRVWGVPITVVYCKACRNPLLRAELIDHVAGIFERESSDAWYTRTVEELLPAGVRCDCGGTEFDKEYDILDVWFDSGASHHMVLDGRDNLRWPADIYLEGGDQYRGWFHSSLLVAVGTRNSAPYRSVVCHGFVLDAQGRAMHKHLGNVISPLDVAKESGAEILRLWAASADYTEDTRFGVEIAERLREAYRKLRNTARFLLGNLYDFTPAEAVSRELLGELDRWALARAAEVAERVEEAYRRYEFHVVYHALHNFCVVDLSSFYLDILKDRLYTAASGSVPRRAAQTALFLIADALVRLMAPILPFTAEEIWGRLYPKDAPVESVHMAEFSRALDQYRDPELLERWERFQQMRERTSKALEESRKSKLVGNSLEARLDIRCGGRAFDYLGSFGEQLRFLLLVSQATLSLDSGLAGDDIEVVVTRAEGSKCERCWNFAPEVGSYSDTPTVCSRCRSALKEMTLV